GFGPGAGLPGEDSNGADGAGGAGYSTHAALNRPNDGGTYGSPLLIPLIGGSGGGGSTTGGGGAGAGAILVASNTRISVPGRFFANGGSGTGTNGGSGGAVRLVAPKVEGTGFLQAVGSGFGQNAGDGRFRIDTLDHSDLALGFQPNNASSLSIGSLMVAIPAVNPRLDIIEAAGTAIPVGSGPVGITLPNGSSTTQNVVVQATDFEGVVDVDVVVTPENGDRTVYPTTIDMGTGNPAQTTVVVEIPLNVGVKVNCYSR
ncbi:MAG: hypothetical protein KC964_30745, partial [Candidatus Omnitrophica bacterium]|nr:hypothetical protein [Candidatus Omnitrophota bacterium]